ncbi:HhH-GPD-type base excision DNA repair protein [Actinoalloteichus hymeniacidonis]|uniref:HhH-GPD domain-containing protein n=1 Tax=Actinoalloteichus hymeniacidonis TaxID=340345 RepID=A0AAC9MZS9_9PSEU|nr:HhH-GPD-type base excision DNA repair protein [Actinoalloteichus hymeniacidonis]AOS64769.1 hypothetical protein TL08_19890 [Actinoalloteichus hymeniacidonis]MBB5907155.1 putative HhH-GPD family protein [Actinoalloteichus hymeniacidonis]
MTRPLCLAQDSEADALLARDPFALLCGMLLDQQIPMEKAFKGPRDLAARMDGFDLRRIAEAEPTEFAEIAARTPAIHRFPGSMAKRLQALAQYLIEHYDGEPEAIWTRDEPTGEQVRTRLQALPGFGEQKARIFLALLGKQRGIQPAGWREAAGAYGGEGARRSVADVVDSQTLAAVRATKQAAKKAAKEQK